MGIEYQITIDGFDLAFYEKCVEQALSAIEGKIERSGSDIYITFPQNKSDFPDVFIQRTKKENQFIFVYNGGTSRAWSLFGMLTSGLSSYSDQITINEL